MPPAVRRHYRTPPVRGRVGPLSFGPARAWSPPLARRCMKRGSGQWGANVAGGTWGMDHTSALCKAAWRCVACGAFYSSPPLTGTSMTTAVVSTAESTVDISTPTLHMNFVLSFSWVVHASGWLPHTRARRGPLDLSRQGGGTPMRPRIRGCGMGVNMMTRKDCLSTCSDMHL